MALPQSPNLKKVTCLLRPAVLKRRIETVTARSTVESDLINISLIDRKTSAHLQAKFVVDTAKSFLVQHRAAKNERATSSALVALPFSQFQLFPDVGLSEGNEIHSPEFAHQMNDKMKSLHERPHRSIKINTSLYNL